MANLIVISGPHAVGKMTVAEKLKEKIGYSLMTNHDSIELSDKIFGIGTSAQKIANRVIRNAIFDIAIENNMNLIFTFITVFDQQDDIDYLNKLKHRFEQTGGTFYFVELKAALEIRLQRNTSPHRLESKLTKNNIEESNRDLLETMKKYRLNSNEDEFVCQNHLKIDNTNLNPEEVADIVIKEFDLNRGK